MSGNGTTWDFEYNADGLRTKRVSSSTTYQYVYNGSSLVQMTVGNNTLYFTSDTVTYNGTTYYYAKNLQGDIVAILNASGTAVVQYTYDAWGKLLSTTGSMANTLGVHNPLRYRGYVYDTESALYYLQSRYYDPGVGRFVNADAYTSTGQGVLGNNMFAYCGNNPVNGFDPTGEFVLPFPTLLDYYWMHKYVQYDIVESYGYGMEVYVVGPKGTGRLDIYNAETNEYYEVKHQPAAGGDAFDNQMARYDVSHVVGWRFSEYEIDGDVTRGSEYISGMTRYKYWDIHYRKAADGLIIYTWTLNETRYMQYMTLLAATVSAGYVSGKYSGKQNVDMKYCE